MYWLAFIWRHRARRMLLTAFVITTSVSSAFAAEYYVSPSGAGDGSKQNPWNISTALNHPVPLQAGDTVWLREGVYGTGGSTLFRCALRGTKAAPVIVRGYPGERAIVNGGIETTSTCAWVWWWDFEITNTSTARKVQNTERPAGLNLLSPGHRVINMIIHNTGHPAIGFWNPVTEGEIYGTLLFGNGLYDLSDPRFPDGWTRGSGIYAQNKDGDRLISDVISFRNFTTGMKVYTEGGWANGFTLEGNVAFDNHEWDLFATAKTNPMQRFKMVNNYTWREPSDGRRSAQVGYYTGQGDAVIRDNYLVGGSGEALAVKFMSSADVQANDIISAGTLVSWIPGGAGTMTWNNNRYSGIAVRPFDLNNLAKTFQEWHAATGFDAASNLTALPTQNIIFVRKNKYERGRAHIIVYNWQQLTAVQVDLSAAGIMPGSGFEIKDAQNIFGTPVVSGTFQGSPVTIPMTGTAVTPITGTITHFTNGHSSRRFNVFIVRQTGTPGETPGSPTNLRID